MERDGEAVWETILYEVQGSAALLTVSRPRQLNALNRQVLEEVLAAVERAGDDPEVRVLVITGQGPKAFVAGADIAEMEALDSESALEFSRFGHRVLSAIENLPKPTIAAINGYALGGGCELALACDIRIASENARLGQPEVGLGIIPGFGGTQRLARLVGKSIALELILSGRAMDAGEALRVGLVNRVVGEGEAVKEALLLAGEISSKSAHALRQAKKAVSGGLMLNPEDGLRLEKELFAECFRYPDQKEGMRAFLEKRKPRF